MGELLRCGDCAAAGKASNNARRLGTVSLIQSHQQGEYTTVGYLLAWWSNRAAYRRAGSLVLAAIAGFAGLVGVWWAIGAVSPIPPLDGTPLWEVVVALLLLLAFPLGAFYISARFFRRALRDEHGKD
jgi:hypothetical protein